MLNFHKFEVYKFNENFPRAIIKRAGYKIEECIVNDGRKPVLCVIYEPTMDNNTPSPTRDSEISHNDDYQINEIDDLSDWDVTPNDIEASTREAIKIQATEVVGSVLNDLEAELTSQNKPIEAKVKFVVTKALEPGTSRSENKTIKKHKGW